MLKYPVIVVRKILNPWSGGEVLFSESAHLILKLADRKPVFDSEVAQKFLDVRVFYTQCPVLSKPALRSCWTLAGSLRSRRELATEALFFPTRCAILSWVRWHSSISL